MDFETLIQQPESRRDDAWEAHFLDGLIPRKVDVEATEPTPGPDGWPYLRIRVAAAEGGEPFHRVVRWLAGRGIGLVVNSHKMMPDYVFTYGMIWNFIETGRFVMPPPPPAPADAPAPGPRLMGAPTPKYLPPYVREILREFLKHQGFAAPRVLVITTSDYRQTDLTFSTESLNDLPESGHKVLAEALHWFLPQHYAIQFLSEVGLPAFTPL
jgi:hypothetical protein